MLKCSSPHSGCPRIVCTSQAHCKYPTFKRAQARLVEVSYKLIQDCQMPVCAKPYTNVKYPLHQTKRSEKQKQVETSNSLDASAFVDRCSKAVTHFAVISLLMPLKMVLPLAIVTAVPAKPRIVAKSGREGVTSPTCCRVPLPVTNSTCKRIKPLKRNGGMTKNAQQSRL